MGSIIRIITGYGNTTAIDKAIQTKRCSQDLYLFDDLLHFPVSQWIIIQSVDSPIILEEYVCPVAEQFSFRVVLKNLVFPAFCLE